MNPHSSPARLLAAKVRVLECSVLRTSLEGKYSDLTNDYRKIISLIQSEQVYGKSCAQLSNQFGASLALDAKLSCEIHSAAVLENDARRDYQFHKPAQLVAEWNLEVTRIRLSEATQLNDAARVQARAESLWQPAPATATDSEVAQFATLTELE